MTLDRVIAELPADPDADLMLCHDHGIAYQSDRAESDYDKSEGQEITRTRIEMVARHYEGEVLDIGIGSGDFVKNRPNTYGFDVNPVAVEWLKRNDLWSSSVGSFDAVTFWDVIEHVPNPGQYLDVLRGYVFASIPVVEDLTRIRESKHYRKHLQYFKRQGFIDWMKARRFELLEWNDHEAGVNSFAFKWQR